jgi:SAM-dependent methyltransferase
MLRTPIARDWNGHAPGIAVSAMTSVTERVDPEGQRPLTVTEQEHWLRYEWARSIASGEVLDIACGTGYGSRILAQGCEVTGIDKDEESVQVAVLRGGGRFRAATVPPIPADDGAFDTVVSFETLEHIEDDVRFVHELRRVLRADGTLLISTPNKDVTSPEGSSLNPWHVREYTLDHLRGLLRSAGFSEIKPYAQRFPPGSWLRKRVSGAAWHLRQSARPGPYASRLIYGRLDVRLWNGRRQPVYWILLCR